MYNKCVSRTIFQKKNPMLRPLTTYALFALVTMVGMVHVASLYAQIGSKKSAKAADDRVSVDDRVGEALEEAGLKFHVNKFGDYVVPFIVGVDENRRQVVFVESATSQWGRMEIREVFSYGYSSKTRLSQVKLEKLLKANGDMKSGAWELSDGKELLAIFSVKVAADCDGESLSTVVRGVAEITDEVEESFTGKDDH